MAITTFTDVFLRLENLGLTDVLLPFLLIFTITFAVIDRVKIFGDKRRNISMVVALCISLLVVIPHVTGGYPPGADVIEIISSAIPNVSVVIIAVVMLLIMIGVFGVNLDIGDSPIGGIVTIASLAIVFVIFGKSAGWFGNKLPSWLNFLNNPNTVALVLVLLMFGIIINFITADPDAEKGKGIMGVFEEIGRSVKKQ